MEKRLQVHFEAWPFVGLIFPVGFDESVFEQLKAAQLAINAREDRFLALSVMPKGSEMPPAKLRKDISVWTKAQESYLTRVQIANVLVIPSTIIRMGVQAVQWFAPPPCPTVVVDTVAEGEPFLRAHMKTSGTPVPQAFADVLSRLDLALRMAD